VVYILFLIKHIKSNILVNGEVSWWKFPTDNVSQTLIQRRAAMGDFSKSYSPRLKEKYKIFALGYSIAPDYAWWAPEQLRDVPEPPTAASDIYAFASTIIECLTLKKPFSEKAPGWQQVHSRVTNYNNKYPELSQRRPNRPKSRWMTDRLWEFMLKCWADEPKDRPPAGDLVNELFNAQRECELQDAELGNPDSRAEQ